MSKQGQQPSFIRGLIAEARVISDNPDSMVAVKSVIMGSMWSRVREDEDLLRMGFAEGIGRLIATEMKTGDGVRVRSEQLAMWPAELRDAVEQIDRERVFVPSRKEYVEVVPDALSIDEMDEAGEYLIKQGNDCILRGDRLRDLAEMRRARLDVV